MRLDGRIDRTLVIDADEFKGLRDGYAGTIYKGQGRTLDRTYLYHSSHWRASTSYVALTRHRVRTELFVAAETARDLGQLARQMALIDDTRAASQFERSDPIPARSSLYASFSKRGGIGLGASRRRPAR